MASERRVPASQEERVLRAGRLRIPLAELTWRFDTPGGPGGQHANRTASRVEVTFDVEGSPSLGERQRARILDRLGPQVTAVAADSRSQARNRQVALDRLTSMLSEAMREQRPRRRTRPSRSSQEERLASKRRRSDLKRTRGRVEPEE
jgi:ribosome-associated protein